tara:strand:- start:2546 stop:3196 length:651 start_codon:yes stop_codon:yes gene_type:complete
MLNRTSILKQPNKISYFKDVFKLQETYQNALIDGSSKDQFLWIGEHKLCYTIGKGGDQKNILPSFNKKNMNILRINRGGEVTCHLPGQLVVYLVLDLNNYKKDLNWYLRKIEQIIIEILYHFNIDSSTKKGFTGVWCHDKKIASIGIGCKRWVTIHGFSLNVNCDLSYFNNIVPCGIKGCLMTKISEFNPSIKIIDVKHIVKKVIQEEFNFKFVSE